MNDKVNALIARLVEKTKAGQLTWTQEQPLPPEGSKVLRATVGSNHLRLAEYEGLQVHHWGAWEFVSEDLIALEPLFEATGIKQSLEAELSALIREVLAAR